MQIIRFLGDDNKIYFGYDYDKDFAYILENNIFADLKRTKIKKKIAKILCPIIPSNILCVGLNYHEHAKEINMPLPKFPALFMKNTASVLNPFDPIIIPKSCQKKDELDYEIELAVIIGKQGKNIKKEDAKDYILGYTIANDVSARIWQKHGGGKQWVRSKSFDSFCPFGPQIVTTDEIKDPQDLDLKCFLNKELMQNANTQDMIFGVFEIIEYLSSGMSLLPGTLILTGTPKGVGYVKKPPIFLKENDHLELEIEKLGCLSNPVKKEL